MLDLNELEKYYQTDFQKKEIGKGDALKIDTGITDKISSAIKEVVNNYIALKEDNPEIMVENLIRVLHPEKKYGFCKFGEREFLINYDILQSVLIMIKRVLSCFDCLELIFVNARYIILGDTLYCLRVSNVFSVTYVRESLISDKDIGRFVKKINRICIINPKMNVIWSVNTNKKAIERFDPVMQFEVMMSGRCYDIQECMELYHKIVRRYGYMGNVIRNTYLLNIIRRIRKNHHISYDGAIYVIAKDICKGIRHTRHEVIFHQKRYDSKRDAYRKLFPNDDIKYITKKIRSRQQYYDVSWEEAIDMFIRERVIHKGIAYESKKELYEKLFPERRYESVYRSIRYIMSHEPCTYEKALELFIEIYDLNPSGGSITFTYNGQTYHSIYKFCGAYKIDCVALNHYRKIFNGDLEKAIEYVIQHNKAQT